MTYSATIEKALAYLQAADIPAHYKKIAPLHKFLWQKDIALPSVILADFRTNAILFGIGGVIFWQIASLIMSLFLPMPQPQTWAQWLFGVIFFAVFFGCSAADYYRRQRRKFGLPSWQEIQNTPGDSKPNHKIPQP
jgi:hypothetical protein